MWLAVYNTQWGLLHNSPCAPPFHMLMKCVSHGGAGVCTQKRTYNSIRLHSHQRDWVRHKTRLPRRRPFRWPRWARAWGALLRPAIRDCLLPQQFPVHLLAVHAHDSPLRACPRARIPTADFFQ